MAKKRKIHRLISIIIWVPILMFSTSGAYHLLHSAYSDHNQGLTLNAPLSLSPSDISTKIQALNELKSPKLNAISMMRGINNRLMYRLGMPNDSAGHAVTRTQKFDSIPVEKSAIYIDAISGKASSVTDKSMAIFFAKKHMNNPSMMFLTPVNYLFWHC